jgi:uncharacterized membrane protein YgcG
MSERRFDDTLDAAIEALHRGDDLEAVLARVPADRADLRSLIETAAAAGAGSPPAVPAPTRLDANYARLRSAVLEARAAEYEASRDAAPSWWRRPVTFASLSLPAGVVAVVLFAGGGAAAATIATQTDVPARVVDAVVPRALVPDWAARYIPGATSDDGTPSAGTAQGDPTAAPAVPGDATAAPPAWAGNPPGIPPYAPGPPEVTTLNGTIENMRGNTFELRVAGDVYRVTTTALTSVEGDLADGATATVTGDLFAGRNVNAMSIVASGAAPAAPPAGPPDDGGVPAASPPDDGGAPSAPPVDPPAEPPVLPGEPPGQDPERTPPGQGQGGGNGRGGDNGNNGGGNGNGGGSN